MISSPLSGSGSCAGHRAVVASLLVLIAVLAAACQSGSDDASEPTSTTVTSAAATTQPEPTPTAPPAQEPGEAEPTPGELTLDNELNHLDLVAARWGLDSARALWAEQQLTDYVVTISTACECSNFTVESLVYGDEGTISRLVVDVDDDRSHFPKSAEDIFARAEGLLSALEADPSAASDSECGGTHLYLRFDSVTGAPLHVSDNTPCDGGVGWNARYEDLEDLAEPIADRNDFTIVEFGAINPDPSAGPILVYSRQFFTPEGAPVDAVDFAEFCSSFADSALCVEQSMALAEDLRQTLYTTQCVQCAATHVWVLIDNDGQVAAVRDVWGLRPLLGTIDTPTEVNLMAQDEGPVRETESGWEQLRHRNVLPCDPVIGRNSVTVVTTDGAVYETGRSFGIAEGVCI